MIIDKIANAPHYTGLIKSLGQALEFIDGNYDLLIGRHEFAGGAVISSDITSMGIAEKDFEAHKSYADVMFVLEGEETVSYCPIDELTVSKAHDDAADCGFYSGEGKDIVLTLPAGYFYAVMPGEGHKPCVHTDTPKQTRKYVIKCRQ